jgi:hypothetical protein
MGAEKDPYAHIDPRVRHLAGAPDDQRRACMVADLWVPYPAGEQAVETLLWLVRQAPRLKMPSFLFCASPHMGKSKIIERFEALLALELAADPGRDTALVVATPPTCDERRLYEAVLLAMQFRTPIDITLSRLQRIVIDQLTARRVRLLIFEEMQQMVEQRGSIVRVCLNTLKYLSNELRLSIAGFGSGEAKGLISFDAHLAVRFTVVELESWSRREPWVRKVVENRIGLMPLRQPTSVDRPLLEALRAQAKGRVGDYFDILESAGLLALDEGVERLTPELIDRAAERRRSGKR